MSKVVNQITLTQDQKKVDCPANSTVLQATLAAKINHTHACGGVGKCSTCRIGVIEGIEHCQPRNKAEQKIASKLHFPDQIRLACQTTIMGDILIRRLIYDDLDMEIVDQQFSDQSGVALGTERSLTIVFTDIVNYTSFAEQLPSYDIVHVLNRYFKTMNEVIQKYHGFISDTAGDGILALFGNNGSQENSVLQAIKAVKDMQEILTVFNTYLQDNYNRTFAIRAGIHYGDVILGSFDIGSLKKVAVIGDNVNLASRIETANKNLGTGMLLSAQAYEQVKKEYPKYESHRTSLKGKTGEFELYEIITEKQN